MNKSFVLSNTTWTRILEVPGEKIADLIIENLSGITIYINENAGANTTDSISLPTGNNYEERDCRTELYALSDSGTPTIQIRATFKKGVKQE